MLSNNPWSESFLHGGFIFETKFVMYSLGYILMNCIGNWCHWSYQSAVRANPGSPPDSRSIKALVASRPTVIAATIHSVSIAVIAVGILILYDSNGDNSGNDTPSPWVYRGINLIQVWRSVGLPISLSYFATDCYFYCLPRKDALIFMHHLIMCFCHYPVVSDRGASLGGGGDMEWVTWLSIVGYTSEVSTAIMNYRWYLINTLEENWICFGIVNGLVVISWLGRVVLFTYLLIAEIFPRKQMYAEIGQLVTYGVIVCGHAGIGLLSLHWCIVMCRGGLRSLFVFTKKRPKILNERQRFSFAEEVGGTSNIDDDVSCFDSRQGTKQNASRLPVLKTIEEEAQAYKDGTIFSERQKRTRRSKKKN